MQTMEQTKGYKGIGMDGKMAKWYEANTRRDMPEFEKLAVRLSNELAPGGTFLDLAPGPGFLSVELAKRGQYEITGLDISKTCVELARENARKAGVQADFRLGNASAMPFAENSFDLIVCRAAFKNFSEPQKAIDEMYRVLKPGGRALIIDLRKDVSMKDINAYVDKLGLGGFDSFITKSVFRFMLIPRAHTTDDFHRMAGASKFRKCDIEFCGIGLEVTFERS